MIGAEQRLARCHASALKLIFAPSANSDILLFLPIRLQGAGSRLTPH
jgi:hypothetical protein